MLVLMVSVAAAVAAGEMDPVDGGELSGSAYTLPEGTTLVGLNTELAHGFAPGLQAGTRVLDWRDGPSAWLEWSFGDTGSSAWALSTSSRLRAHGLYSYTLGMRHTWGPRDGSRLSVGLRLFEGLDEYTIVLAYQSNLRRNRYGSLAVPVTADVVMGRHTLQLRGSAGPTWLVRTDAWLGAVSFFEDVVWDAGVFWAVGWRVFRLSAGVEVSSVVDGTYAEAVQALGLAEPPVEVAPRLRLWWAF